MKKLLLVMSTNSSAYNKIPVSSVVSFTLSTRGVEGTMRKTESIFLMTFSWSLTGTERERAIIPCVSLIYKRTKHVKSKGKHFMMQNSATIEYQK